jgi:lactate dehydrogenase-like 2-hydroxyacid dehydrogenase
MLSTLTWEVFLAPSIPAITSDVPPGETERPWPPISSTLISGERDAILVDIPITVDQARALVNWLVARGKNLTTIYATHGHGDLPQILITPHIAGATDLTFHGTLNYVKQVIDAFAAGEKPKSVINTPAHPRRLLR